MTDRHIKPQRSPTHDTEESILLVSDMVRYLLSLANLYEKDKTGNKELSQGLRSLAHALRPFGNCAMLELADAIKEKAPATDRRKTASTKPKSQLPRGLESIDEKEIDRILNDESYTKKQMAELGLRRFGISRSKLERLRKQDARDSIRAALEHEKSLDVIAMEARRGGKARSA